MLICDAWCVMIFFSLSVSLYFFSYSLIPFLRITILTLGRNMVYFFFLNAWPHFFLFCWFFRTKSPFSPLSLSRWRIYGCFHSCLFYIYLLDHGILFWQKYCLQHLIFFLLLVSKTAFQFINRSFSAREIFTLLKI